MLYIVIVTPRCNLHCAYCGGSLHGMPGEIQYHLHDLAAFIAKDAHAVVAFYGGEPLLEADVVKRMIDTLPAQRFVIQTNGFFMERMESHLHRLDTVLLSVDGREEVTDFYRGEGCYRKVMDALAFLKSQGFRGEVIARMAASSRTDIYEDVMHLLQHFPLVHWQLDAVWSTMWDLDAFSSWVEESYHPGLERLVRFWVDELKRGVVHGIVPFLGIASRMFHGGRGLPCGAGSDAVTIATDGTVMACPIAPDFSWNVLGTLGHFERIGVGEPCTTCDVYGICGGRCLFTHKERLWGEEGFERLCDTTRFLIREIARHRDEIAPMRHKLRYPPFNNTTEIIP